ncbi:transcriptional regulator [Virgisporangium aliadipatigenens]|uniref:Transcriptional regulator n=1 Tax=Virgisporangium aliadipatigenens TaxID=741659 RepID=A0A8J3YG21_9ACTN|nr:helix-turn-helix domain-containing protein [Virgisporangium aliadipatigenens]GIJ43400.1 transcriptional regulator [Virgisporangium aliadipatigenens]
MSELGATLRAWRDRLSPADAGLPQGPARRAKGLRREELADLARISVDYVVRLEQGRFGTPSAQVLAALARALRLSTAERDHLYRLAGQAPPADGRLGDRVPPGLRRVVDRLGESTAVAVFAADWHLLRWNPAWAALVGDPAAVPPAMRNFARETFPLAGDGPRMSHWPVVSHARAELEAAAASDLRRATGRFPHDPRLSGLIATLVAGNDRFARLWSAGAVGTHRADHKVIEHPGAGPIEVDCDVLTDGDAELKVVILTPVPESEARLTALVTLGAPV